MSDEVTKTEKEKAPKPETTQNSLTAAIGLIATATIGKDNLVLKGVIIAAAPFISAGVIWLLTTGAEEWKFQRKKSEPVRSAKAYLKTIEKQQKKAIKNSPEWAQLEADRLEVGRMLHSHMLQGLRVTIAPLDPPIVP